MKNGNQVKKPDKGMQVITIGMNMYTQERLVKTWNTYTKNGKTFTESQLDKNCPINRFFSLIKMIDKKQFINGRI